MGFAETLLANAETLVQILSSFICSVGLDISHCRGQSYDGAANMSGHLNGVQKRFHDKHPSMLFVHCSGHQINLAVQDVFRCTDGGMNSLDVLTAVVNFILSSPKRLASFQRYALGNNCSYVGSLRPLCPTRWVLRYPAIDKFLGNYEIILNWLEEIAPNTQSERTQRSSARSYIGSMEKFETYYMLRVLHFVLQQVNNVHTAVQSRNLTVGRCRSLVEKLIAVSAANNTTEAGEMFFEECRSFAGALGLGLPVLPRGRRSSRLTTGNSSELDVKDHYVNMYHVILQETQDALTCRYPAEDLKIATSLEWYLLENNEERIPAIANQIESFYSADIEAGKLTIEHAQWFNYKNAKNICISTADELIEAFKCQTDLQIFLPTFTTVLRLYMTLPCTTCEAERSFSALRRLKTYLRSQSTQERLNSLAIMHVHKEELDSTCSSAIIDEWINVSTMRQNTFAKSD